MDDKTSLAVETLLSLGQQEWTPPSPATSSDCSERSPHAQSLVEEEEETEHQLAKEDIKKVIDSCFVVVLRICY